VEPLVGAFYPKKKRDLIARGRRECSPRRGGSILSKVSSFLQEDDFALTPGKARRLTIRRRKGTVGHGDSIDQLPSWGKKGGRRREKNLLSGRKIEAFEL